MIQSSLLQKNITRTCFHVQIRNFGLKPNRFKKNKCSRPSAKAFTRKSWVLPKSFRGYYHRRAKKLSWTKHMRARVAVLGQKEIILGNWEEGDAPLAVQTASDARTEGLVRRFSNLGIYSQKAETQILNGRLSSWVKTNTTKEPGRFRKTPKQYQVLNMLHHEMIQEHPTSRKEIDFHFKPGDVVEIEMYTSLKKGTTHTFSGMCVQRRQNGYDTSIVLRNTEKDGLVIRRIFPIYSPWFKGLRILQRFTKFKKPHLDLLEHNFPDIWNPEEVHERLEVIKQDIIDKRKHMILVQELKKAALIKAKMISQAEE